MSISNLGYPFKNGHWTVSKSFLDLNLSHFEIQTCTGFLEHVEPILDESHISGKAESREFLQQGCEAPKRIKNTQVWKKQMHNYHGQQLVILLSIRNCNYSTCQYKGSQWWWNDIKWPEVIYPHFWTIAETMNEETREPVDSRRVHILRCRRGKQWNMAGTSLNYGDDADLLWVSWLKLCLTRENPGTMANYVWFAMIFL